MFHFILRNMAQMYTLYTVPATTVVMVGPFPPPPTPKPDLELQTNQYNEVQNQKVFPGKCLKST